MVPTGLELARQPVRALEVVVDDNGHSLPRARASLFQRISRHPLSCHAGTCAADDTQAPAIRDVG
jgi:hypothetical protein